MLISMVFDGDITNIRNEFNTLFNSCIYAQKRVLSAPMVDAYTFLPQGPVVMAENNLKMVKELTKRPDYCLITVSEEDEVYSFTLYSSNLDRSVPMQRTYRECRLVDPIKELLDSHTAGTILIEDSLPQSLPEDKVLTEEDIYMVKLAREEKSYPRAKSLVKKVYPRADSHFNSKQGLRGFCTKMLNADRKTKEEVLVDGTGTGNGGS